MCVYVLISSSRLESLLILLLSLSPITHSSTCICVNIYVHMCVCIYIYIYIYTHTHTEPVWNYHANQMNLINSKSSEPIFVKFKPVFFHH